MSNQTHAQRFIGHLWKIVESKNRGALADLRSGLQYLPGEGPRTHRHVAPHLPLKRRYDHDWYYLVGALFASHTDTGGEGNLGASFGQLQRRQPNNKSIEHRFVALLSCHPDDLHLRLRHAIGLLASNGVPVDWGRLLADLTRWGSPRGYVQRQWAMSFYTSPSPQGEDTDDHGN